MNLYNPFTLEGKTILIVGSTSGIGESIAIECSRLGAKLVLTGRNLEKLEMLKTKISNPDNHFYFHYDFELNEGMEEFVEGIPPLQGVVHCSGFLKKQPFLFSDEQIITKTFNINLFGPWLLTQKILKRKKLMNESSIVFISSIASEVASIGNVTYMSSKGALNSLVKGMALELSKKFIRVNSIEPALVLTDLTRKALNDKDLENYRSRFPLGRFGKPEEIAHGVIFLLSDATKWITGTKLRIDGGITLIC